MNETNGEKIPQMVYDEFDEFIEEYGENGLVYLGELDSKKYYAYLFFSDEEVGFPKVCAYDGKSIENFMDLML